MFHGLLIIHVEFNRAVKMAFDVRVYNVVVLGFAFMALFTAFQTTGIIEVS